MNPFRTKAIALMGMALFALGSVVVACIREPREFGIPVASFTAAFLVPMLVVTGAFAYPRIRKARLAREALNARVCIQCGPNPDGRSLNCPKCGLPFHRMEF